MQCYCLLRNTVITEAPTSVTSTLGSVAKFKCVTGGSAVTWLVDGMAASKQAIQDRGITFRNPSRPGGGIDSTISVRASEENNNTVLVCRVNTGDSRNVVDSDPAVLKVQGS